MENSWYSKCGSMWQQSPPPLVASSSRSHTQFFKADRHLDMQLPKESMSLNRGTIQEHVSPNMHDLKNLGHAADLGGPLLSLLSGPPTNVSYDLQHLLDPKPVPLSSQVSLTHGTANGFSAGSRVSELPSGLWPHNMDCQNLISGDVIFPLMSSNSTLNSSNGSALFHAANLNFEKSQPVACQNPHEKDKVKSFSSPIGNNNAGPIPANTWKPQKYADITALQKVPAESNNSAYHHGHNPSSSFPHVFCSGISGNLLLSDTGLLGVVCACHGLYMSIAKFSEHSGSCDFDPGSAVRMDNGETIAQWWKTSFSKSGIRFLEGHRRWDWPEGISAASGSTDHPISNMSNNSVSWNEIGSFRTSVSSEQKQYSVSNLKGNQSCRNIADRYAYHEKDRTSQECSNSLFKYFINSSHRNLPHSTDKQIWGVPNPFGTNSEKASHSTTAKLDSVYGSANSLPALPNIQDLKTPFIGFGVRRNTSFIVERPGVSSNIELRLGGPREQRQTLEPPKVLLSDKLLQKRSNELQGSKWTLQNADIATNPIERRGPIQLEHSSHVGGAYGAITDYRKDSPNGNLKTTHLNPPLLPCLKNLETKWQFGSIYDNGNDSRVNEKLHYESHAPKGEKNNFPWSGVAGNIKEFHIDVSNVQNHTNKSKKLESAVNGLLEAAKSNIEFSNTFKKDLSTSNIVLGKNSSCYSPAFHEKKPHLYQKSNRIADESYDGDILNNCWKISSLSDMRHFNHDQVKPIQNSISSKETTSIGFTSKSSVFVQSEKMQMPALQNMVELSGRDNDSTSVKYTQGCEMSKNPRLQSLMTTTPSISKDHVHLLDSSRMPKIPEVGEKSTMPGTICWMGRTDERFSTMTGRSPSTTAACDLPSLEQFFVRPDGIECNFTLSKKEQCSQGLPYAHVPEKRNSAVQANCLMGKYDSNGDYYCSSVKRARNGAASSLFHSKLNDNRAFLKERTESLVAPNFKSVESHSFQWRDVPKKIMESCSSTRKEQQADSFNASLRIPAPDVFKCFTGSARNVVPVKEHEISIISSGCSAPDVTTQSSIEVNKKDSSTAEAQDIRCAHNLVLDEGSGNDRSWSSVDALDNEFCAAFSGSASRINLIKRGPSLGLIEEIRPQNSFKCEYAQHKIKRSTTFQEESDCVQKFEVGSEKRRKMVKLMKLDLPCSVSGQSSINNECPKCTEEVGQNAHPIWNVRMPVGCDEGSPSNCLKQTSTAFSAAKGISIKRDLKRVYLEGEQHATEEHKSFGVDDTLETFETFGKKRLRLDDASASRKGIREICCSSAELNAKSTLLGGRSNSKPNFPKWMARPLVFGKYGIISNGNLSKPTKIIPLSKIVKTCNNDKQKSISVKVKETSARRVKETALCKKVHGSGVKAFETHDSLPLEPEPCDLNGEIETASYSATNGSDDLLYTSLKWNNHGITDSNPGPQLKRKYKEGRKRSLHELLIKGTYAEISSYHSCEFGEKSLTCARTEGYKGRKREGFLHNHPQDANGNAGCLVPQEQLNAWLHIHRQMPQRKGRPKLPSSIVESDCRKAYARYKQSKGWKHLVVYKSGIHALGLYTSQFISRGAMVVEYVGEIVGLRVADRRESEYHSGKKLQHKSACYFFRIDKEHIIDATRKGGIARFVNHSCQPNCVAKVISVRNEKKVVFFAERDIYPGEEITYDYHFNHEDEGEKIPCYCKSKNCRRYLN